VKVDNIGSMATSFKKPSSSSKSALSRTSSQKDSSSAIEQSTPCPGKEQSPPLSSISATKKVIGALPPSIKKLVDELFLNDGYYLSFSLTHSSYLALSKDSLSSAIFDKFGGDKELVEYREPLWIEVVYSYAANQKQKLRTAAKAVLIDTSVEYRQLVNLEPSESYQMVYFGRVTQDQGFRLCSDLIKRIYFKAFYKYFLFFDFIALISLKVLDSAERFP
jgi:hypothetical protein